MKDQHKCCVFEPIEEDFDEDELSDCKTLEVETTEESSIDGPLPELDVEL